MNKLKLAVLFISCVCIFSCSDGQTGLGDEISIINQNNSEPDNDSSETTNDDLLNTDFNILFIGNSLTYTNDLPDLVKRRAKQRGIILGTKMIAHPNYAIVDHWNFGSTQEDIASKKFDFVIIQQGPSSQPLGREILIDYGKKYNEICTENDAKLCYFMVWPALINYQTYGGVIKNHRDAASINNAILCPVGEVWKEHFDATDKFDYYSGDGFHPSLTGSQVAANVIVESLFPIKIGDRIK